MHLGFLMRLPLVLQMFLQMAKPNYQQLLSQIAQETDPEIKEQLEAECYQFTEELTEEEKELFDYVSKSYIENNPGTEPYVETDFYPFDDALKVDSYVGVYYYEGDSE